ncbi:MAG: hypothetical protein ACK4SY_09915 [Pyrobaculum sp.]
MRWLYVTFIIYWLSTAISTALAMAGHPVVSPQGLRETVTTSFENRLLGALLYVALVALFSYPALFLTAALFGVLTPAVAAAFGVGELIAYIVAVGTVLVFLERVAWWHPFRQRRGWRRYVLWLAASVALVGLLSL